MIDITENTESRTTDNLKALLQEAEQALYSTATETGDKFDEIRRRLRSAIDSESFSSLAEFRQDAKRRMQQGMHEADKLVRENPYYAVGVAAGIGALVGVLVSRSCSASR